MSRIRYDRSDLGSTIRAAVRLAAASNRPRYVFATAYGYTVETQPAPYRQAYYQAQPDGTVRYCGYELTADGYRATTTALVRA